MNIQIFGKNKCFDTKKAQRWFKERGIKFQMIDLAQKGMSKGELDSVLKAVGGLDNLLDQKSKSYASLAYLAYDEDKKEKLLEDGEYTRLSKARSPIIGAVSGGYWLVVVAVFLYYTYGPKGNGNGQHSWFIWAIAGVLFAAIMLVLKTVKRSGKKD